MLPPIKAFFSFLFTFLLTSLFSLFIVICFTSTGDEAPIKTNNNIEGTYLKIQGSDIRNIIPNIDANSRPFPLTFRKDTLTNNKQTKEIFSFKFFGLEKSYPIKLYEVQNLKIKGLSGDNYYITDIKTTITDNKTMNVLKLSHVNSSVLKTLDEQAEKEIVLSDNSVNLKKDDIVKLSKDNKISTIDNIKEKTIDYSVERKTYYKYDVSQSPSFEDFIINILDMFSFITLIVLIILAVIYEIKDNN